MQSQPKLSLNVHLTKYKVSSRFIRLLSL